jgi:type I restriction enzyme S subunit
MKSLEMTLPPIDEQSAILNYINNENLTFDSLISKYQKQIDLMQEYRTSLISQAITGKIDVREWQPKRKMSLWK